MVDRSDAIHALREIGRLFYDRGWSRATSSNYSVVLSRSPLQLLLTASGKNKGALLDSDFVVVDENGGCIESTPHRPSAETRLHCVLAKSRGAGAVLHTHSPWGTILSDVHMPYGGMAVEGYEMLKGLDGIETHDSRIWIEIFENTQDMDALGKDIAQRLDDEESPLEHGFLIHQHGLYTWGDTLDDALRHLEVFEFLFEVLGRRSAMRLERPMRRR